MEKKKMEMKEQEIKEMNMRQAGINEKGENGFIGFEYKTVTARQYLESVFADGYANFGWILEGTDSAVHGFGNVTMKFKRDRKVRNKAEITRLQRQFDACISEIETLERSKILAASAVSYGIGLVGCAFMAGSVFAYIGGLVLPSIVLAIPGFMGWIVPYFAFCGIRRNKTGQVNPLIDQKYDEIYAVCEKGNGLLQAS